MTDLKKEIEAVSMNGSAEVDITSILKKYISEDADFEKGYKTLEKSGFEIFEVSNNDLIKSYLAILKFKLSATSQYEARVLFDESNDNKAVNVAGKIIYKSI